MKSIARALPAALIAASLALMPAATLAQTKPAAKAATKPAAKKAQEVTMVLLKTSKGEIKIALNAAKAPITVANFLTYVGEKFFDGTIFHRVIPGFMIQGGGLTPDMQKKPVHDPIKIESSNGLKNDRGTVAMARTPDPNSATSQFFINVVDNNSSLDRRPGKDGYTVFGKVVEGMDVVDIIRKVKTNTVSGRKDVPVEVVMIESITVVDED